MSKHHDLCLLDQTFAGARDKYVAAVEEAERVLEAKRTHWSVIVQNSAKSVAELEGQLETFEALEHERMAAQVRRELSPAIEEHQAVCRNAARCVRQAFREYIDRLSQAVAAMSAEFPAE